MTDEEITALVERLEGDPDEHSWQTYADAASAIRQLMRERDEAFHNGQMNMQLRAAAVASHPDIFDAIRSLRLKHHPKPS